MQFELTDDQALLYETTRRYLETEAPTSMIRTWAATELGYDPDWWTKGTQLGWTQMLASEELGGGCVSGARLEDLGLIAHAFGRAVAPGPLVASNVCAMALDLAENSTLAAELSPRLVQGSTHGSPCGITRGPGAIRAHGSGSGYRLAGRASPVEGGASASHFIVAARHQGGTALIAVPPDAPGVTIRKLGSLDLSRRFAEVSFDSVEVGTYHVLVEVDHEDVIGRLRQAEQVLRLCETVGCIDRVFEFTCEWAFERHSFGRPLASYQELKHRFADMKTWLEACHATTDAALAAIDGSTADVDLLVAVACAYVGEKAPEIVQDCVQVHGGIGVTADHDIHLYLRRVTQNRGLVGSPYGHRQAIADLIEEHA